VAPSGQAYHRSRGFLRRGRDCSAPEDQFSIVTCIFDTHTVPKGDWHNQDGDYSNWDRRVPGPHLFSVAFYAGYMSLALVELLKSDAQERIKEAAKSALEILCWDWGRSHLGYEKEVQVEAGMKPADVLELVKRAVEGEVHIAEGFRLASTVPPEPSALRSTLHEPRAARLT
jgi:hypothetical protein